MFECQGLNCRATFDAPPDGAEVFMVLRPVCRLGVPNGQSRGPEVRATSRLDFKCPACAPFLRSKSLPLETAVATETHK